MSNQNIINQNEEDLAITKRILLKEQNIRILASKMKKI